MVRWSALLLVGLIFLAPATDAFAGEGVYWTNVLGTSPVSFANLDGSGGGNLNTTGATVEEADGVAIDTEEGKIYWANGASSIDATPVISWDNALFSGG